MDTEVEGRCGAGSGEVSPERVNSRKGYRRRDWDGRAETAELAMPGLMARHPVLRPGDTLRLAGETHTVAGLGSATVRLIDVTGAVKEVPTVRLLADPGLELVTPSRVPLAPQPLLERLPEETVEHARWWERHLIEVITGVPPDSPPGTGPRPAYDPAWRSLRQRELAKHEELTVAGHRVGLSTSSGCAPGMSATACGG
jgi:hypothetical protein